MSRQKTSIPPVQVQNPMLETEINGNLSIDKDLPKFLKEFIKECQDSLEGVLSDDKSEHSSKAIDEISDSDDNGSSEYLKIKQLRAQLDEEDELSDSDESGCSASLNIEQLRAQLDKVDELFDFELSMIPSWMEKFQDLLYKDDGSFSSDKKHLKKIPRAHNFMEGKSLADEDEFLEKCFVDYVSLHTFPLLSDNFIISSYDKLTQVRKDHVLLMLNHLFFNEEYSFEASKLQLSKELSATSRYEELDLLPLVDGKSAIYSDHVLLRFIFSFVEFEGFWQELTRYKNKSSILEFIFQLTSHITFDGDEKQNLKSAYGYLQECVKDFSLSNQKTLVFIFDELGFDQDKLVKKYLLKLKQDSYNLTLAQQDLLSLILYFFPYEDYKKAFESSFKIFKNEKYILSKPVSIDHKTMGGFEKQLLAILPQSIFQAKTFDYYLDLYHDDKALKALLKCQDISKITYFNRIMLAAKATMVDYEKKFSDLKVKQAVCKLLEDIPQLVTAIHGHNSKDKICKFIDSITPQRLRASLLEAKLNYISTFLNDYLRNGKVYDLYEHLDGLNLLGKSAKPNFPRFAINGLLKLKASTIKKVIDTTSDLFEKISSDQDSDGIFAIIDSLIPASEELGQNPIEVFKQKLAYLKKAIAECLAEPRPIIDQEIAECLAEPSMSEPIRNQEFAAFVAEPRSSTSAPLTDLQIDYLYDCFYRLKLCPYIELPDNRKLTTHISKYTKEHLSSFSGLANLISSHDQPSHSSSPSSEKSSSSEEREFDLLQLVAPVSCSSKSDGTFMARK